MYFQTGEPPGSVEDDHIPFLRRGTCYGNWGAGGPQVGPGPFLDLGTGGKLLNLFVSQFPHL